MNNKKTKATALALALSLSIPLMSQAAGAVGIRGAAEGTVSYEGEARAKNELTLKPVYQKNIYTYKTKGISYATLGKSGTARVINGYDYISLRSFAAAIGGTVTYDSKAKISTLKYGSSILTVGNGTHTMYINGRPIFSLGSSVIMSDGLMYTPLESLANAFGMRISSTQSRVTLSGRAAPLTARVPYTEDEIFWLARIIEAESSGESLLGKVAVGTVVLNRVASSLYPNTIYGVIFDRKYGVQFSPVQDGRIYNTPSYQAKLAARICLEGYRLADNVLFFLAPEHSTSSWIPNSREYVFSIMHHDFYA